MRNVSEVINFFPIHTTMPIKFPQNTEKKERKRHTHCGHWVSAGLQEALFCFVNLGMMPPQ